MTPHCQHPPPPPNWAPYPGFQWWPLPLNSWSPKSLQARWYSSSMQAICLIPLPKHTTVVENACVLVSDSLFELIGGDEILSCKYHCRLCSWSPGRYLCMSLKRNCIRYRTWYTPWQQEDSVHTAGLFIFLPQLYNTPILSRKCWFLCWEFGRLKITWLESHCS